MSGFPPQANMMLRRSDGRERSKAAVAALNIDVRFTPHNDRNNGYQLRAGRSGRALVATRSQQRFANCGSY
jgi:hypothetical protein